MTFPNTHTVEVRSASDLLAAAQPAIDAGVRKVLTATADARHVFLVVHPLDFLAAEWVEEPLIAPSLPAPVIPVGVDAMWVLWPPGQLAVWSACGKVWTEILLAADRADDDEDDEPLATEEARLLGRLPGSPPSPYQFRLSSGG